MSKYRKGRVLVLASMIGFTSITVLAGTGASAPEFKPGKIAVSDLPTFPKTKGKMKNVLRSACVFVQTKNALPDGKTAATFKADGALAKYLRVSKHNKKTTIDTDLEYDDAYLTGYKNVYAYDLSDWLPDSAPAKPKLEKKGYHIEIRIGKEHRKFWVLASGANTGCDVAKNADGKDVASPPKTFPQDDTVTDLTQDVCKAKHIVTTSWNPTTGTELPVVSVDGSAPGEVSVMVDKPSIIDPDTVQISVDNTDVATSYDATTGTVSADFPAFAPGSSHSFTAYVEVADNNPNNVVCSEATSTVSVATGIVGLG